MDATLFDTGARAAIMPRPYQIHDHDESFRLWDSGVVGVLTRSATGTGKCLGRGTPVLLYSGETVPVEAVRAGDRLLGPDSRPRLVISTSTGHGPLYRITPVSGGDSFIVNDAHVLTLKCGSRGKKKRVSQKRAEATRNNWLARRERIVAAHLAGQSIGQIAGAERIHANGIKRHLRRHAEQAGVGQEPRWKEGKIIDIPLGDYLRKNRDFKKFYRGFRVAVEFTGNSEPLPIDPYFLGVWLGDGHSGSPSITTADVEIQLAVEQNAAANGLTVRKASLPNTRAATYHVSGLSASRLGNHIWDSLCSMLPLADGDWACAEYRPLQKRIPNQYKLASRQVRLAVLAGLMDTDGYLCNGISFDFISASQELANDVAFVARSVGFKVTVSQCVKRCTNNGAMGTYWRLYIAGDCSIIPTRIPRKQAKPIKRSTDVSLFSFNIEAIGNGEYFGFALNEDGRFLLGDFTVTHNTLMAALKIDTWLRRSPDHRAMIISYERQLVWQFAQEIEEWLGIRPGIEMERAAVDPANMPAIVVASRASLLVASSPTPEQQSRLAEKGITELGAVSDRAAKRFVRLLDNGAEPCAIKEEIERINAMPEAKRGRWSRVHKFNPFIPWLLVFDEAHRHAAHLPSVGHLIDWFGVNPESRRNGLTATPKRSDNVSIGDVMFPGVALDYPLYSPGKPCAVNDGWAVKYLQRYIEVEGVDFRQIAKVAGDFDEGQLERVLGEETQLAKLCVPLLEMAGNRKTLIFSPGVDMAKNVAAFINARRECRCPTCQAISWQPLQLLGDGAACKCGQQLSAEHVLNNREQARELDGESPEQYRKETYQGHQRGGFQFLSVCGLCIAKGTLVLTDCGEVPIEQVTTDMELWDGVDWVSHDGVISKGKQPVIRYAGLTATAEHHVLTNSGWERFAACKQFDISIKVAGIRGEAVLESSGYYRDDSLLTFVDPVEAAEEVLDILNAGPRHRFTANGLIVSNCREGFNDPDISCVAVFRPVSKRASSLAEQMKGRSCRPPRHVLPELMACGTAEERVKLLESHAALIVDLVGITGLADCASTVAIYAEGKPDEIVDRAAEILAEQGLDAEADVQGAIDQAEQEAYEAKEKARLEREAAEEAARQRAAERAKADAEVRYNTHEVGQGSNVDPDAATEKQYAFMRFLGMEIHTTMHRRKAGRIITQLKLRVPLDEIARTNRLGEGDWQPCGPSDKQRKFADWKGVPHGKSGYEQSLLIDAKLNADEFVQKQIFEIGKAWTHEDLTACGKNIVLVKGVLPQEHFHKLVSEGQRRRSQLQEIEEPIPE